MLFKCVHTFTFIFAEQTATEPESTLPVSQ